MSSGRLLTRILLSPEVRPAGAAFLLLLLALLLTGALAARVFLLMPPTGGATALVLAPGTRRPPRPRLELVGLASFMISSSDWSRMLLLLDILNDLVREGI